MQKMNWSLRYGHELQGTCMIAASIGIPAILLSLVAPFASVSDAMRHSAASLVWHLTTQSAGMFLAQFLMSTITIRVAFCLTN